jgi:hypothetical protein
MARLSLSEQRKPRFAGKPTVVDWGFVPRSKRGVPQMNRHVAVSLAAVLALTGLPGAASAFTLSQTQPSTSPTLERVDFICGPGRHVGYEGKHCWANHPPVAQYCPPGYHWGYEGKHCWPNH